MVLFWQTQCFLPCNVGHQSSTHDQDGFLSVDTKLGHRVHDAQEGLDALGLLANHRLVDAEVDLVVVKVLLHGVAVDVEDVQVHDGQAAAPFGVTVGQVTAADIEDVVDEAEVVLDLLVTLDVEAVWAFRHGCFQVRHGEDRTGSVE